MCNRCVFILEHFLLLSRTYGQYLHEPEQRADLYQRCRSQAILVLNGWPSSECHVILQKPDRPPVQGNQQITPGAQFRKGVSLSPEQPLSCYMTPIRTNR